MNTNAVADNAAQAAEAYMAAKKTSRVTTGKTIGNPELSEKAQKYYDELRKKFGDMDFILVSPEMKEMAEANASAYASPNRTVVLIDTDKIERMAEDEEYRKKYEGIISNARSQISQMQQSLQNTGANVKTYGIKVNDGGTASFFAVIDKSLAAQKDRIAENAKKKAEDKKTSAKKEAERKREQRAEEKRKANKKDDDTVTITASSADELVKKVSDYMWADKSNQVETEWEKMVGHGFDYTA